MLNTIELSQYLNFAMHRGKAENSDVDDASNDPLDETPHLEKPKQKNKNGTPKIVDEDMPRTKDEALEEYLAQAIKRARPRANGNMKVCESDRHSYWLEAVSSLTRVEQEEGHRVVYHASYGSYVEPTAEQAEAIIKHFAFPAKF